jgi:hypothetical protein
MDKAEEIAFTQLTRKQKRVIENNFKKNVKKGYLVKVYDANGNSGYVTKEEYLQKTK